MTVDARSLTRADPITLTPASQGIGQYVAHYNFTSELWRWIMAKH